MSGIFGSAARVGGKQRINNGAVRAKGTGTGQGGTEHRGRATTEPPQSHQTATMLPARTVLLLSLLLTFSLHHAAAHFAPVECCFKYAQKPIRHPQSFYETSKDCPKPAVVIVAASGDEICADPKKSWVKKVIKRLQKEKLNPSTI